MSKLSTDMGVVIIALETVYGEDEIAKLMAADGDLVYQKVGNGADLVPAFEPFRFDLLKSQPGGTPFTPKMAGGTYSIPAPFAGGIGTNFEPEYSALLEISGMKKTVPSAGKTLYTSSTDYESATVYRFWRDSQSAEFRLRTGVGCQGSFSLEGTAGESATLTGAGLLLNSPKLSPVRAFFAIDADGAPGDPLLLADGTAIAPAYAGDAGPGVGDPMVCVGQTVTVDGTNFPVSAWTLDHGVTPGIVPTVQAADGVGCVALQTSNQTGNLALEACDGEVGLDLVLDNYDIGTQVELVLILRNSTCQITITMNIQFTLPTIRDQNGQAGWDIGYETSGSYTILFEALA